MFGVAVLYQFTKTIWLTRGNAGAPNYNLPMNEFQWRVYKRVENNIDFIVRTVDRVPIDLTGAGLLGTIMDPDTGRALLQRQLNIINPTQGQATWTFLPSDTHDWEPGIYNYSVILLNTDSSQEVLYIDQNQLAKGQFSVDDGLLPDNAKVYEVRMPDWTPYNPEFNNTGETVYRSSALPGNMQASLPSPLHTVAIYPRGFFGVIRIQGSLAQVPDIEEDWFTINLSNQQQDIYFNGEKHHVEAFNFFMNLQWVRFEYHIPAGVFANTPQLRIFPPTHRAPERILFKN
jgi:hypothetical protein